MDTHRQFLDEDIAVTRGNNDALWDHADANTGELPRGFPLANWQEPPSPVLLEDGWLAWDLSEASNLRQEKVKRLRENPPAALPAEGLLAAFIELHDAAPGRIAAFAARYGPLEVCKHSTARWFWSPPGRHDFDAPEDDPPRPLMPGDADPALRWCMPSGDPRICLRRHDVSLTYARLPLYDYYREPVCLWRAMSAEARGMLRFSAALRRSGLPDPADCSQVTLAAGGEVSCPHGEGENPYEQFAHGLLSTVEFRQFEALGHGFLLEGVNNWLRRGEVAPMLQTNFAGTALQYRVQHWVNGLFGALAVELLHAIASQRGLVTCAECGRPFAPIRNTAHYCPDCRDRASWRDRKRRQRAGIARTRPPRVAQVAALS